MSTGMTLFGEVMDVAWSDKDSRPDVSKAAHALYSHAKSYAPRINVENAFDILGIYWPDATVMPRIDRESHHHDEPGDVWYDVAFPDKSQCLVLSRRGIGSAYEPL